MLAKMGEVAQSYQVARNRARQQPIAVENPVANLIGAAEEE